MSILKKLFLKEEELVTEKKEATKETMKFPSSDSPQNNTVFNNNAVKTPENHVLPKDTQLTQACEQHMGKLLDVYQKAFDNLNMQGYDFYEFLDAIISADETGKNPLAYTMAFSMATKMDKSITKDSLSKQADYYITEINKAHMKFVADGNTKKTELIGQKDNESKSLSSDLDMLNQQLESIKIQIDDKKNKLSKMDDKYQPQINEVDCKLIANDAAKDKIVSVIQTVKNGVETNIK